MSAWRARGQAVPQLQAEPGRIPWRRCHLVLGVLGGKGSLLALPLPNFPLLPCDLSITAWCRRLETQPGTAKVEPSSLKERGKGTAAVQALESCWGTSGSCSYCKQQQQSGQ